MEVREVTWLHDDIFDTLARHGAALCIHDMLPDHPWLRTADFTYVRFHGPHALEREVRGSLWRAAAVATGGRLRGLARRGPDVYAYFNNDVGGERRHRRRVAAGPLDGVSAYPACRCDGRSPSSGCVPVTRGSTIQSATMLTATGVVMAHATPVP